MGRRTSARHMEREQVRKDATADMSSDLSEGQRESTLADGMPPAESNLAFLISNTQYEEKPPTSSSSGV
jgi:sucrose-phosphate synthase